MKTKVKKSKVKVKSIHPVMKEYAVAPSMVYLIWLMGVLRIPFKTVLEAITLK
jgi:hypothetical protein